MQRSVKDELILLEGRLSNRGSPDLEKSYNLNRKRGKKYKKDDLGKKIQQE